MDHGRNSTLAIPSLKSEISHLQQNVNKKKSPKLSNSPVKTVEFAQTFDV